MTRVVEFECEDEETAHVSEYSMRPYQAACVEAVREAWKTYSRVLAVLATGTGKTVIFSQIAKEEVDAGGKVLILAHTDELLEQARDKLWRSTGIDADKEKASDNASPHAKVVVASIQTISRDARLLGFSDDHFSLIICDESHRALAKGYQRVLRYFHFGAESLVDGWVMPEPSTPYVHKARCLGVTATADRGDGRSLGEFYQQCVYNYGMLEACRDGYLVRPIVKNVPIKIDLKRRFKGERIVTGGDYNAGFLAERMAPFMNTIARAIAEHAKDRKTVCFLPSVECARMLSSAMAIHGLDASFVSGACLDRDEKIADFHAKGNGAAIANAMLLTEGWDCPDASCICVLRPTKIRSLFTQCVGRATRTLPGVIDELETRDERLAAIAASAKPDMMILDFLWLTDTLDLIQPVDLVTTQPEVRAKIVEIGLEDLIQGEAEARDLLAALEKATAKNKNKAVRVIDPLKWAVSLGDAKLSSFTPTEAWEMDPPTEPQKKILARFHMDASKIATKGLAQRVIGILFNRSDLKLATPAQLNFLKALGIDEMTRATVTQREASILIERRKAERDQAIA